MTGLATRALAITRPPHTAKQPLKPAPLTAIAAAANAAASSAPRSGTAARASQAGPASPTAIASRERVASPIAVTRDGSRHEERSFQRHQGGYMIDSPFARLVPRGGDRSRRVLLQSVAGGLTLTASGLVASPRGSDAKRKRKNHCPACGPRSIGSVCETTSQCCGTETNMACVLLSGDTVTTCRGTNGAACTGDTQCIDGFLCVAGRCRQVV